MKILQPTEENLSLAAEAIREGELVLMPTETVYGLACDATNPEAVQKVFAAKGRPSDNPLIVHAADFEGVWACVNEWSDEADVLARAYWPGPLTLVLPKAPSIPEAVTAGLATVAVRVPNHPVALSLIRESRRPIAAPSANRFMRLSPTRVEHVEPALAKHVSIALDGGASAVGIESTVIDLSVSPPTILRPGAVSRAMVTSLLGALGQANTGERKAPGSYSRHYAPRAKVAFARHIDPDEFGLTFGMPESDKHILMPRDPELYAAALYDILHTLDAHGAETVFIDPLPEGPEWEALRDRLAKAAGPS